MEPLIISYENFIGIVLKANSYGLIIKPCKVAHLPMSLLGACGMFTVPMS